VENVKDAYITAACYNRHLCGHMHELQAASRILEIVERELNRRNLGKIKKVGVRVGAMSGFDPEALRFSFEALVFGTALDATRLEIEFVPVRGTCGECGREFSLEKLIFICPECGSGKLNIVSGEELEISYLEKANDE
jgi:hydrogenase nickel incorporation protein HypA/HybF